MIQASDLIAKFEHALNNDWGYIWGASGETWTAAAQAAATREQTRQYGAQWIGHRVADCSGLFSWAFKELGGYMYHGSNTMYKSYCTAKGTMTCGKRDDGKTLKPGTAVFCYNEDERKWSHVGLYIGNGYVIEAAGTRSGVIRSSVSNRKWENWGELKGVQYDGSAEPDPGQSRPTLRKGDKGDAVKEMQEALLKLGYDLGSWGADGSFGNATLKALRQFQNDRGLTVDGICGAKTWAALAPEKKEETVGTYTVTISGLTPTEVDVLKRMHPGKVKVKEEIL